MVEIEFNFIVFGIFFGLLIVSFILAFLFDSIFSKKASSKLNLKNLVKLQKILNSGPFSKHLLESKSALSSGQFDFAILEQIDIVFNSNNVLGLDESSTLTDILAVIDNVETETNNVILNFINLYQDEMNIVFNEVNRLLSLIRTDLKKFVV